MPYQVTIYSKEEREEKRQQIARENERRLRRAEETGTLCSYQPKRSGRWWGPAWEEEIHVNIMRPEGNLQTDGEWHRALLHALNNLDLPVADKRRLIEADKVWKRRPRGFRSTLKPREKAYLLRHLA